MALIWGVPGDFEIQECAGERIFRQLAFAKRRSTIIQPTSQRWDQKKAVLFALLFGAFQDQGGFHLPDERHHQRPKAKKIAE
jgi:hypothetical protein